MALLERAEILSEHMFCVKQLNRTKRYGMLGAMSERQKQLTTLHQLAQERQPIMLAQQATIEQLHEAQAIEQLAQQRQELARRLKDERARASDLDWTLEDIEVHLRTLTAEGHEHSDPLTAREVTALRKRQALIEDQILEQLETTEQLEREQAQIEATWLRRSGAWAELSGSVQAEAHRLATALAALDQQRQAIIATLSESDQAAFDAASGRYPDAPLSAVEDQACSACGAALSAAMLTALDRDHTAICQRCNRLLITLPDGAADATDSAKAATS